MKKFRAVFCILLALALLPGGALFARPAQASAAYYYDTAYEYLIGAMEVVNCQAWTSLRAYPNSHSQRLAQVPVGTVVTNCYYQDDKFTYCEYEGVGGYILTANLSFIAGPAGYEYPDTAYLGNMQIVNCASYASLRQYPDTRSTRLCQVPLGSIVTNVYYQDDRFCYCVFGEMEGYILTENLAWISGGYDADEQLVNHNWIGDCVIINCIAWASLRELPDTASTRLARVPLGAVVTNCYYYNDRFACCTYDGKTGYILIDNLGQ